MEDDMGDKAYKPVKSYTGQQDNLDSGPGIRPVEIQVITECYAERYNAVTDDRNN
jgi:hypothetical protein